MNIAMTYNEAALLNAFLRESKKYLEFGSGGSTYLAAQTVKEKIISVDSSVEWLNSVEREISSFKHADTILHHVDIGKTGDWGYPSDSVNRDQWPNYSKAVWFEHGADSSDLFLIDGRFRVACFAEATVKSKNGSIILIHDFGNRPQYHIVKEFIRCVATVENLSAFVKDDLTDTKRAAQIANDFRYVAE